MNEIVVFHNPTHAEIDAITEEAHRLRSRAIANGFARFGHSVRVGGSRLWSVAAALGRAIGQARIARRISEDLSRMSDRELADMGLTRGDIPAVVAGTFRRAGEQPAVTTPQPVSAVTVETSEPAVEPEYRKAA